MGDRELKIRDLRAGCGEATTLPHPFPGYMGISSMITESPKNTLLYRGEFIPIYCRINRYIPAIFQIHFVIHYNIWDIKRITEINHIHQTRICSTIGIPSTTIKRRKIETKGGEN